MRKAGTFFDNKGNLYLPKNIFMPGELKPPLKPREWIYWLLFSAENKPNDYHTWFRGLGSRATFYRVRQKLMKEGYF